MYKIFHIDEEIDRDIGSAKLSRYISVLFVNITNNVFIYRI